MSCSASLMDPYYDNRPEGFVPVAQYNRLYEDYKTLEKHFNAYKRDAEERTRRTAIKLRQSKERIRAWQDYIDKKLAKQAMAEEAMRHQNLDFATPRGPTQTDIPVFLPHPTVEAVRHASRSPAHSRITSSQTTEGEAAARSSPTADNDDDIPVVVSARSLKRKTETPRPHLQTARIKQENLSSSPINSPSVYPPLLRTETSDLDIINQHDRNRQSQLSRQVGHDILQRRRQIEPLKPTPAERLLDHAQPLLRTPTNIPHPTNMQSAQDSATARHGSRSPDSCSTRKSVKSDPGANTQPVSNINLSPRASKSFGSHETRRSPTSKRPLHNLSPNTPILPRTSAFPLTSTAKKRTSHGAEAVHFLTEDGDHVMRSSKRPKVLSNQETPNTRAMGRLESLLDGSSPQVDKTILSPRTVPAVQRYREPLEPTSRSAEKPVSRFVKPTPTRRSVQNNQDPGPVLPEHEPLRSRPLHRLNADDFKVNSNYSEQLGFAYRESVRKREQRRCLPGCTREECCGAIRRFIEAGGLPMALSDDELTLQGYLGSQYAQIIHQASAAERQKMLGEARAKAFADRHGKHRQVFERRTTPPGFWRTDMPTTQEMEEDREEARKMERQKIEERWRDAMRGGGRYMFRDE